MGEPYKDYSSKGLILLENGVGPFVSFTSFLFLPDWKVSRHLDPRNDFEDRNLILILEESEKQKARRPVS